MENVVFFLRARGLRITQARLRLLKVLFEAKEPLSLEEIHGRTAFVSAEEAGEAPDFATVFRTVTRLEELGLAHRVDLGRSKTHYELSDPAQHYDHLVCVDCGVVQLVKEECPVADFERRLGRKYGFRDVSHSLQFYGRCPACTGRQQ
ncbi:MAG TPA: Fur family transcriptional regulator [Chthoniobacterales bacterium]